MELHTEAYLKKRDIVDTIRDFEAQSKELPIPEVDDPRYSEAAAYFTMSMERYARNAGEVREQIQKELKLEIVKNLAVSMAWGSGIFALGGAVYHLATGGSSADILGLVSVSGICIYGAIELDGLKSNGCDISHIVRAGDMFMDHFEAFGGELHRLNSQGVSLSPSAECTHKRIDALAEMVSKVYLSLEGTYNKRWQAL